MALIECSECKAKISDAAKACPHCGHPMESQTEKKQEQASPPKKKMGVGKKILYGFLALVILGAVINATKSPEEKAADQQRREQAQQQKAANVAAQAAKDPCANIKTMADWDKASTLWQAANEQCKPKEEKQTFTVIPAVSLWREFDGNEVAAEKKYLKKRVAVEGVIYKIESSPLGYPEVVFNVSSGIQTVKCQFTKKSTDDIAQMRKGQKIIAIGTVRSFVLGSMLSIDDCVVGQ